MRKPEQQVGDQQIIDFGSHNRVRSRSVSWNSTGSWLAWASSDRMGKIWTIEGGSPREVVAVSGHTAPVDRVRFHPSDPNLLLTTAQDRTVRLWDLRGGSQHFLGRWDLQSSPQYGSCPASVEWHGAHHIVVTERNDCVHIYDSRKARGGSKNAYKSFDLKPNIVEGCQVSPNGEYLVATTTTRGEGMGEVRIWTLDSETVEDAYVYPGHTGPIYQFCFSPDGTLLATGGSDAIVGIWDTQHMVCTQTITRRTKFVRSVSFSHDSQLLANSTEEDGIDIAGRSGEWLGTVYLQPNKRGGAEEICFHPKEVCLLACARDTDSHSGAMPPSPVTVVKW
eukprot:CAMPEP_0194216336 /NCGR_PEP_ID=MMETSP0156-20130528/18790_1 /TAXON_ID=33649 /ORGANISM="Thalassionema nitzschioides, Strain L26-B" /LENGTH=335 /DNA_ID=CAMNT_0038945085 /DNA_START=81 /DNA_END=1085 /DNA_ORIENTATION=+